MSAVSRSVLRSSLLLFALAGGHYFMGRPDRAASQVAPTPPPCPGPIGISIPTGPFPRTIHLSPRLMANPSTLGAIQVSERTNRLYAVSSPTDRYAVGCGTLWALDARTGSVVSGTPVQSPAGAPRLDDPDGKLLIPVLAAPALSSPQSILDIDTRTDQSLRSQELGRVWQVYVAPKAHRAIVETSNLVCGLCRHALQFLDVATGKISQSAPPAWLGSAAVDNGRRQLFTVGDGKLSAWDVSAGTRLWARLLPLPCGGRLAIANVAHRVRRLFTLHNGTIERYSLGDNGYMCTFDASTGRRINVRDVGFASWPTILAIDGRRGVILADVRHYPTGEDLELLDPATGNASRTLRGPHSATTAAVDRRTGHIFILCGPEAGGWSVWVLDPKSWRASRLIHGLKLGGNPLSYQVVVAASARRVLVVSPVDGTVTFLCADTRC